MFLGHFGVALAAKRVAPKASLGTLFLSAQLIDLVWPTLLLLGVERVAIEPGNTAVTPLDFLHYPWTHSLMAVIVWGLLVAAITLALKGGRRLALLLGLLVVSHWLLDLLVHAPDLPIYPGGELLVGFGLWDSLPATLLLEAGIFAAGVGVYLSVTAAPRRRSLWALLAFLVVIYAGNVFGAPPPDVTMLAWVGHAQWLLVLWAWWADRPPRAA